nr:hypothetical protein GCM10025732_05770 [Glycomyces mayteni]
MPQELVEAGHAGLDVVDGAAGAVLPAVGHVLLEAADAVVHVVDAAAAGLLHDRLDALAFGERVEHRGDRADLQRVGPEEHEVVEDAVHLGERHAQPHGPLGDLDPGEALGGEGHSEFGGERRQPVVPVGQQHDLPEVAHLVELLGAAVHVADDRLAFGDALAVDPQLEPEHPVRGGVLRADVEHHVGRLGGGAHADDQLFAHPLIVPVSSRFGKRSHGKARVP